MMKITLIIPIMGLLLVAYSPSSGASDIRVERPLNHTLEMIIHLDHPGISTYEETAGGLIVANLNHDERTDYLITVPGHIMAYANDGTKLWIIQAKVQVSGKSERFGLPGHHGPGLQAADVDGDGATEVLYLTQDSVLHVIDGSTGNEKWQVQPPIPPGAEKWEHVVVTNFRGQGDRDVLLQATNATGYRMGRYLAAYAIDDLQRGKINPLWERDDFLAAAHNGARVADLNGDGKDEVLGGMVVGPDGAVLLELPVKGHIDSVYVADVRPDIPGLEVVALEEGGGHAPFKRNQHVFGLANRLVKRFFPGGNHVFLFNHERLIWQRHYKHQEPQNAAVGEFDLKRPGLEVWCRSRYNQHQKPFLFDSHGQLLTHYAMDDVAPQGWTTRGVEVIWTIDWSGGLQQLAAAKERHKTGDVAIFDPVSGRFLHHFKEEAARLYIADVAGDWREELIVLNRNELHIYHNTTPNPNPNRPRLWTQKHYRRNKMTWNYYSP